MNSDSKPNPLDKLPAILKQNLDKNLCTCMDVPKMDVINAIANGACTLEAVKKRNLCDHGQWLLCAAGRALD